MIASAIEAGGTPQIRSAGVGSEHGRDGSAPGLPPGARQPITAQDVRELAGRLSTLHLEAFPGFFLTSLGPRFLRRLYGGFLTEPSGVCVVAEDGAVCVGFAAGTTDPKAFFGALLRRQAITFALAAVPGLLRNPAFVARKCLGALTYRGEEPKRLPGAALLSSLAVSPAAQGQGVGRSLVRAFAAEARARGAAAVYLLTDEKENERTNRFYVQCGFALLDTFARPGRRIMNRWVLPLGGGA